MYTIIKEYVTVYWKWALALLVFIIIFWNYCSRSIGLNKPGTTIVPTTLAYNNLNPEIDASDATKAESEGRDPVENKGPKKLTLVKDRINLSSPIYNSVVSGDYLYLAAGDAGIKVFDISNTTSPQLEGIISVKGECVFIVIKDPYIIAFKGSQGIEFINISSSRSPTLDDSYLSSMQRRKYYTFSGAALSGSLNGDQLLVNLGSSGLSVLDISSLIDLREIARVNTGGIVYDATTISSKSTSKQQTIYIADGYGGLKLASVEAIGANQSLYDASESKLIYGLKTKGSTKRVALYGNEAYLADGEGGISIVSLLKAGSSAQLNEESLQREVNIRKIIPIIGGADDLVIKYPYLFISTKKYGMQVLDITSLQIIKRVSFHAPVTNMTLYGNKLIVSLGEQGFYILDTSSPKDLKADSYIGTSKDAASMLIDYNQLYIASREAGISVLSIQNPQQPSYKAFINTEGYVNDLKLKDDYLISASGKEGVIFFDVADSEKISKAFEVPTFYNTLSIAISDIVEAKVYAADSEGIKVISYKIKIKEDKRKIDASVSQTYYAEGAHKKLSLSEYYVNDSLVLAVSVMNNGFYVFKIDDNGFLSGPGMVKMAKGCYGLGIVESYLFVLMGFEGLWVYDISNPLRPHYLKRFSQFHYIEDISSQGSRLFLSMGSEGFAIYDWDAESLSLSYVDSFKDQSIVFKSMTMDDDLFFIATEKDGLKLLSFR